MTERNPDTLYILIGANMRMAEEFCNDRRMPRTEIGRHVFPTSMDPYHLRGRRGPIEFVYGLDSDPRPFTDEPRTPREREWLEGANFIQRYHEHRSAAE